MTRLTHLDDKGAARMVDVSEKNVTARSATAQAIVEMKPETLDLILAGTAKKGDVFAAARIAGIMAAKKTSDLIPLCHPLAITKAEIEFMPQGNATLAIAATVKVEGKTGVEMEALTAAAVAALTVYDMCKAVDRGMRIRDIALVEKSGGKSGPYSRSKS